MRGKDPDDPSQGKAWAAAAGVSLTIVALGLLTWMAVDVDADGRSSYQEMQGGTSPMRGDTDGDGVADGWELDHGYDALSAASAPEVKAPSSPELPDDADIGDPKECSVDSLLGQDCVDEGNADGASQDDGASAEVPPAGGSGAAATSAIGIGTTVLASVAGRVIAVKVLHS